MCLASVRTIQRTTYSDGLTHSQGTAAYAQLAKTCPGTNVCYQLNIPEITASSGDGDIYFSLSAPTTYSWIALGQGSQMSGANIFVMYTDSSGTNVTLSPRLGTGHVEPDFDSAAEVTLLAGSGVSNGVMTANVRCSNCNSWSGGTMDFTSSSASWIYAVKSGDPLDSDSTSESISQHGNQGSLDFTISDAKGGSSSNPFVSDSTSGTSSAAAGGTASTTSCVSTTVVASTTSSLASPSGSGCPTAWPSSYATNWPSLASEYSSCFASGHPTWPTTAPYVKYVKYVKRDTTACVDESGNSGSGSSSSSSGSSSSHGDFSAADAPFGGDYKKANSIMIAHGVMAALAFVILFPVGGIMIRLLSFPGLVWVHAVFQAVAYLVYIIAFGLGIYLATQLEYVSFTSATDSLLHLATDNRLLQMNNSHPIIGIVLFVVLFLQPILGFVHHKMFKKYGTRTAWSYGHLWIGRAAITLGIINGGLGLRLAGNSHSGEIAYAVIAAIMWLAYVVSIVIGEQRRRRARKNSPPSYNKSVRMDNLGGSDSDHSIAPREYPAPPAQRYA